MTDEPQFMAIASRDPEYQQTIADAKRTLPDFRRLLKHCHDTDAIPSVKIRLTDGDETAFIWLTCARVEEDGFVATVFEIPPEFAHFKVGDRIRVAEADAVRHTPLRHLKGQFQLTSIGVQHAARFVRAAHPRYEYSRRKADTLLVVDARAVPTRAQACIGVGLLEPHNAKALNSLVSLAFPGEDLRPQQLLVSSSVEPWVYASVYWWVKGAA